METKAEVWIPLGKGRVAVIDFENWNKVRPWHWQLHACRSRGRGQTKYALGRRTENGKRIWVLLHQLVFGDLLPGLEIGHWDGDGLNCREANLRGLTHAQNMQGRAAKKPNCSSNYRGVHLKKSSERWGAVVAGKHVGYFDTEIEAAKAYDAAAIKYFGEHAAPNFPVQKENQCLPPTGTAV